MRITMKRTILILAAMIICASILAGCKGGDGTETGSTESVESTSAQASETSAQTNADSSGTSAVTSEETTETEGINIRPGTDSEHGWGEFDPA